MSGSASRAKFIPLCCVFGALLAAPPSAGPALAATPGLPFTEDFSDTNLRDDSETDANWSTEEQALILAWERRSNPWAPAPAAGSDISAQTHLTLSIALGDVDGDGDVDLVTGNTNNQPNRLYLNNGTAAPWNGVAGSDITVDTDTTRSVVMGDVDGDGDLDLVAGNEETNRLYLNNGTADPWNGVTGSDITADVLDTWAVALGDVDGDGDLDLVAGNSDQANRFYPNNGTADPWAGVTGSDITTDQHDTSSVALGDVDGDGDLDLVVGDIFGAGTNRLYLNNGTADPWAGVAGSDITADVDQTYSVSLGDVDGDGDLDLVTGNWAVWNRLYLNNGTADPWNGVVGKDIADPSSTRWAVLGDVDGDGDLDLVEAVYNGPNLLYVNNGTSDPWAGVAGSEITADSHSTWSVALGDVDGDGDLDLVEGNHFEPNRLYSNNGTADPWGGFSGSDVTTDTNATESIALGDVDGDGDLDLVAGNSGETNRLYLNNGTSEPWNGVAGSDITLDVYNTNDVALGDLDGDGDLDLVAGNSGINRLYLNNGTADPWNGVAGSDITTDAHNTSSVSLGDVDGDGDHDLVAGNATNQTNRLYLNNGTADPWNGVAGSDITADTHFTYSVALGDVDSDGDLDLVVGNSTANRLYLNNGTADPWNGVAGSYIGFDIHVTRAVALGDVDGDGDLDVVAGNDNWTNRLYLNNGTADPWLVVLGSDITTDTDTTRSVTLGDVDEDGDLDLVAGNDGRTNTLYLNNGTADPWNGVTGSDITEDEDSSLSVALGDVDGDGDLDLVAGNDGVANRLYPNSGSTGLWNDVAGSDITADAQPTRSVALGDVDGDGDLDLVGANNALANRLYLNNGTDDPWADVTGSDITADAHDTRFVVLGDVDGDGDLDLVAGNWNDANRLYLNNGTADPWAGVTGSNVTTDVHYSFTVALGDVDRDGDLDLVVGNWNDSNRLYLNNGTADPWAGVTGSDITTDAYNTFSVALGDVDRDGDLDLVAGNYNSQINRLYLNNGTADPWAGVTGSDITTDANDTISIVLGDVDRDGDLDLVTGNTNSPHRSYLNNGTTDPWAGVTGSDITTDAHDTRSVALGDMDGDGDLDLVAGNFNSQANRLYLNNGTVDPWDGVTGSDVTTDADDTVAIVPGDVDGDGDLDLVAGNYLGGINRLYRGVPFHDTSRGRATSLEIDTVSGIITNATLTAVATLPPNTRIDYWMSNDGGSRWTLVQPGGQHFFTSNAGDLRWRAELHSLSPALTPRVDEIQITSIDPGAPIALGDRVWDDLDGDGIQDAGEPGIISALVYLYDDQGTILDVTFTDVNGNYSFSGLVWHDQSYRLKFIPSPGTVLSPQNQGGNDEADSDADPATGFTEVLNIFSLDDDTRWDAGMVPAIACTPPDEEVYLYSITIDGNDNTVLHFMDPNQLDQITGYNVYRSSDPGLPHEQWTLVASDVIDMDEATANKQWVDTSGDPGNWYYQVAAYNHHCPAQTAEGPW